LIQQKRNRMARGNFTHGYGSQKYSPCREYRIYNAMKTRCYNPKAINYHNYGGKGIRICDRWLKSFLNFLEDMGHAPTDKHSIDRYPNKEGNYEPGNCRWATRTEQNRNQVDLKFIEFNGQSKLMSDWARELGICHTGMLKRLRKWPLELALTVKPASNNHMHKYWQKKQGDKPKK